MTKRVLNEAAAAATVVSTPGADTTYRVGGVDVAKQHLDCCCCICSTIATAVDPAGAPRWLLPEQRLLQHCNDLAYGGHTGPHWLLTAWLQAGRQLMPCVLSSCCCCCYCCSYCLQVLAWA
jgi:hypothetical protein